MNIDQRLVSKMPSYTARRVILINFLVFLSIISAIEIVFRLTETKSWTHKEFRLTRPEPYADSPYFSKEFIDESFKQPGGWFTPEGTRIVLPNDYKGRYFNVRNHMRVTTGNQTNSKKNVYVFGGSTVYSSEVPDDYTIPSQLQKMINNKQLSATVFNMGVSSIHSAQQLERLERDVILHPGDMVIFYDGVNDVTQRIYYGNPDGWIANEEKQAPMWVRLIRRHAKHSAFLRWLDYEFITKKKFDLNQNFILRAGNDYKNVIESACRFSSEKGASFFHFLQPTLMTKRTLNEYENNLINMKGEIVPYGIVNVFKSSYPVFRKQLSDIPCNHDLSNIFDYLQNSPYLDEFHVSEVGNKLVAEAIFKEIESDLSGGD